MTTQTKARITPQETRILMDGLGRFAVQETRNAARELIAALASQPSAVPARYDDSDCHPLYKDVKLTGLTPEQVKELTELGNDAICSILEQAVAVPAPVAQVGEPVAYEPLDNPEIYRIWFESQAAWHQLISPKPDRCNHFARALEAAILGRINPSGYAK